MTALILVDLQYDFLPDGPLAVASGDTIIPVVNRIQSRYDLVVATQDWHPSDHISFADNHEGQKPFEKIEVDGHEQILWPRHCVQGSDGAKIHEKVDLDRVEAIFRKGMNARIDSYSAFFDNHHEKSTGLADYLRGRGIKTIHIAGLAADVCVKFTALDAVELGFETAVICDGTKGVDATPGDTENALSEMRTAGVKTIESGDVR